MIVNEQALDLAFKGFKTVYTDAYNETPVYWDKIAMTIPSGTREESYGWLGQFPQLREWLSGERVVKDLQAHGFTIKNRKFEATVGVKREDMADDKLGVFKPMMAEMGHRARQHPDELFFELLKQGATELCYDGQPFFDPDHPTQDAEGTTVTVSNYDDGTGDDGTATPGPTWYLFDTTHAVRPLIWQERENYEFQAVNRPNDYQVFMTDEDHYGVRARVNAGFGLWQLAYASKAPLTAANYATARREMMMLRGDRGRLLGITPNRVVVPPTLETDGRTLLNSELTDGGNSNPWKGTAELIVTPYVAE